MSPSRQQSPVPQDIADSDLVARLLQRDEAAFRFVAMRYAGVMLATARRICGDTFAEDVVQDAWMSALEALPSFEQRASLKTWLLRIVTNKAISRVRGNREINIGSLLHEDGSDDDWFDAKGHWLPGKPAPWHHDSPEALLLTRALQKCVDEHLARLPEQQRSVMVLRDMQGMALEEIEQVVGIAATHVRVLLHRARLKLVRMVDHFEETGEC